MFFSASMLKLFVDFETEGLNMDNEHLSPDVMGFATSSEAANILLVFTGLIIGLALIFAVYATYAAASAPAIRLVQNKQRPELDITALTSRSRPLGSLLAARAT